MFLIAANAYLDSPSQYRLFSMENITSSNHQPGALVALFIVKYVKAFFRVLNTSSRLIAARYYARGDTSRNLKCLYFCAARKTRQPNPLWILCGERDYTGCLWFIARIFSFLQQMHIWALEDMFSR